MKHLGWGIIGGIIALWLFLTVWETQHRDFVRKDAVQERDVATFDKQFDAAIDRKANPDDDKRLQLAQAKVDKIAAEEAAREAQLAAEREQLRKRAGDALLLTPGKSTPPAPPADSKPGADGTNAH